MKVAGLAVSYAKQSSVGQFDHQWPSYMITIIPEWAQGWHRYGKYVRVWFALEIRVAFHASKSRSRTPHSSHTHKPAHARTHAHTIVVLLIIPRRFICTCRSSSFFFVANVLFSVTLIIPHIWFFLVALEGCAYRLWPTHNYFIHIVLCLKNSCGHGT